jgi:hypothetical protein
MHELCAFESIDLSGFILFFLILFHGPRGRVRRSRSNVLFKGHASDVNVLLFRVESLLSEEGVREIALLLLVETHLVLVSYCRLDSDIASLDDHSLRVYSNLLRGL